jgi:hypothetical protein
MASADFQAGVISARDYATAMQIARAEAVALRSAGVIPAGREFSAFNTVLRTTVPTAAAAGQGLGTIRSSLASLTATAVGARGVFGTLGGALLQFASGNMVAIGIIAGIGAIAFAWRKLTQDTREAREELVKLRDEMAKKFPAIILGPEGEAFNVRERLLADQTRIQGKLGTARERVAGAPDVFARAIAEGEVKRLEKELVVAEQALAVATKELGDTRSKIAKDEADAAEKRRREEEAAAKKRLAFMDQLIAAEGGMVGARIRAVMGFQVGAVRQFGQPTMGSAFAFRGGDTLLTGEMQEVIQSFADVGWSLNDIADAGHKASKSIRETANATERFGVAAINTAAAMIAMAAGGGGSAGGFLSLAGGLISFLPGGQIPGAIIGGLGSVISATERDDPTPVRITDVSDRAASQISRARTGPDRVTLYVVDNWGNIRETRELLNRATARDAVPRLAGVG